jgi:hypothetical protein
MQLENEQASRLSLNGDWHFSLAGGPSQVMPVPCAWEAHIGDKITDGPALYRCSFQVPAGRVDRGRLILEFGAVSFWALVRVNSVQVTVHQGMWSSFQVEVTRWVHAGENELEVEVWKPGRRFPVRESVAGFLPDVATTFGGLWQGVRLLALDAGFDGLQVLCMPGNRLEVSGTVVGLDAIRVAEVAVEVNPADGEAVSTRVPLEGATGRFSAVLDLGGLARWQPGKPALHNVVLTAWQNGLCQARASRQIGLRDIEARDGAAWIDGRPLHLRGVLDWGWQPEQIRPTPSREALARQIEQSRALGFNLIKLCLFVPDEATFQAADETGQFLWLEMPLWLPRLTSDVKELVRQEYEAVFRRLHHHASIVVLSLGCELNAEADAGFLSELHALARAWFPNALLCDNSGSGEAYGGVTTALQDFYDYHFYTDPHFFRSLVDHFERDDRPRKPWLFGEFCDADTGRDFSALSREPWWITDPVALDRDDFRYTRNYKARLAAAGVADGGAALTRSARRQATAVRKFFLEQARLHDATGGYVVSGWTDTPITTSGIVDDLGQLKFEPDEWQRFNGAAALLIERPRRRRWVTGGDRPAFGDPFSWWLGQEAELPVLLSNALGPLAGGQLYWHLADAAGQELASSGETVAALAAGQVTEVASLRLPMPKAGLRPVELTLHAGLSVALTSGLRQGVQNRWTLWALPRPDLGESIGVIGIDALAAQHEFSLLSQHTQFLDARAAPQSEPVLACELGALLLNEVHNGRDGVLWVTQADRRFTRRLPFWREAIHVFAPHDLWELALNPVCADMRFFSVATDLALDLGGLQDLLGPVAQYRPVWRRFDARQLTWADYLIEVQYGRGRLFVSSLRFEGGLGRQPEGFDANPWGAWLLATLLRLPRPGGA